MLTGKYQFIAQTCYTNYAADHYQAHLPYELSSGPSSMDSGPLHAQPAIRTRPWTMDHWPWTIPSAIRHTHQAMDYGLWTMDRADRIMSRRLIILSAHTPYHSYMAHRDAGRYNPGLSSTYLSFRGSKFPLRPAGEKV